MEQRGKRRHSGAAWKKGDMVEQRGKRRHGGAAWISRHSRTVWQKDIVEQREKNDISSSVEKVDIVEQRGKSSHSITARIK